MPPARALHVIFCWHMHQPDYLLADGSLLRNTFGEILYLRFRIS
jgi:alpha-amylase/alpha-mannosidase (GH57 family)